MQVAACQLTGRLCGIDGRRRHDPDRGPSCTLPPDREPARQGGVAKVVSVHSQRPPGLVVPQLGAAEKDLQASGQIQRPSADLAAVREPAEREHGEIARRDDVHVVPRSPHLHERGVSPDGRAGTFHARVEGQQRRAGHAVLNTGPGGAPQRRSSSWQPLIERSDASSKREDLRSRKPESRSHHVTASCGMPD